MKTLLAALLLFAFAFTVSLAAPTAATEHPVFDQEGHLIAYVYADGREDQYTYDTKWRMVIFTDREGKTTLYSYEADGTPHAQTPSKVSR